MSQRFRIPIAAASVVFGNVLIQSAVNHRAGLTAETYLLQSFGGLALLVFALIIAANRNMFRVPHPPSKKGEE